MIWIGLALAGGPETWETVKTTGGCEYRLGPVEDDGNRLLWTRCTWPEADAEQVDALIAAYGDHDATWASIATCEEVERTEELVRVRHVHDLPGVSDREIELTWTWTTEDDGATRHSWVRSPEQPEVDASRVNPLRDEGWYLVRAGDTGVIVDALMVYDPGGNIPGWLTHATQVSTADFMMQELREAAVTAP